MKPALRFLLPLAVLAGLVVLLGAALLRPSATSASAAALVGQPAPALRLPRLDAPGETLARDDLLGRPWLLNVWASWCAPCLEELPALTALATTQRVRLVGLNYKDRPDAAGAWLARHGNPYAAHLADPDGRAGIDWGVVGVPETFVIDRNGVVRFKHSGPLTEAVIRERIAPLLETLGG